MWDTSTGTTEGRPAQALYNEGFAKRKILTDAAAVNKISIPLNQYSYFAAFKNQIHPNIKTNILIKLEDDNNIIFRKAAAPDSKVIVTKMRLWCPKIIFNGLGMKEYTEKYLKPKKWVYLMEHQESTQTTATNSFFRISTGIRRPRHVLVWVFQRQAIAAKNTTYSLLKHSLLGQIRDISQKLSWRLTAVCITPSWK